MKNKSILKILLVAFILRFILLLINTYITTLPQGGGDAISFERNAYELSISNYDIDVLLYLSSGGKLFNLLCSFIYLIIGRQPLILGLVIVLLGVYLVKLSYKASLLLWGNYSIAKRTAWFVALFPVLMLHSAIILREIPINVFLLLAIIAFIKYWKLKQNTKLFGFLFYSFLATLLHSGSIFILVGFVFFLIFNAKGRSVFSKVFILSFVLISLILLNASGVLNKLGGNFEESIDLLNTREGYTLKGNSAYPNWIMLNGSATDIVKIPARYVAFLFSPLIPFWARSFWHSIGLIDGFMYLFMFFTIYRKRKVFKINNTAKAILIMTLFLVFVFSLGVANVGTAIRHRAKMVPFIIIVFTGMYYYKIPKNNKKI